MEQQTSSKKNAQLNVIHTVPSSCLPSDGACPVDDSAFVKNTLSISQFRLLKLSSMPNLSSPSHLTSSLGGL